MAEEVFEKNGYTFLRDEETGTVTAKGNISLAENNGGTNRNNYIQRTAGGKDRVVGNLNIHENDEGGHLIAAAENGPPDRCNVFAQNYDVNRGSFRSVERCEIDAVRNGKSVYTEKTAFMRAESERPDAFLVKDTITEQDGSRHTVCFSFTNMSNEEIREIDNFEYGHIENFQNGDAEVNEEYSSFQASGMTREGYDALMAELDEESSIESEFDSGWTESYSGSWGESEYESESEDYGGECL